MYELSSFNPLLKNSFSSFRGKCLQVWRGWVTWLKSHRNVVELEFKIRLSKGRVNTGNTAWQSSLSLLRFSLHIHNLTCQGRWELAISNGRHVCQRWHCEHFMLSKPIPIHFSMSVSPSLLFLCHSFIPQMFTEILPRNSPITEDTAIGQSFSLKEQSLLRVTDDKLNICTYTYILIY